MPLGYPTYAGGVSAAKQTVLIVGAGIVGLTSAFRLARAGHAVTLFDPSPAQGATWAAAGMLAPSGEIAPGEESNYRLQRGALEAWRSLSDELAKVDGTQLAIHETGTLIVGWDASDRRQIEQFIGVAKSFDAAHGVVERSTAPELFVGLSDRIREGVVMAGDAWLDPDEAVALLLKGLALLGVEVVHQRVVRVDTKDGGVVAETNDEQFTGDTGVLATGASALPLGVSTSGEHAVRPVRGLTVRVQGLDRSAQPVVRAYVRGRAFYMLSRPGGYCVLGATSDERSEPVVEMGELSRLLRDALDIVPDLETAGMIETRSGLRPASTDLRPFFEELEPKGWAWSSGHYRHGVTLAPLAALDALHFIERRP
jgi:glycine oxidase